MCGLFCFIGTAGDSFGYHRGCAFSTKDRDNDNSSGNCADHYGKGGWWFNGWVFANLNGLYYHGHHSSDHDGVNWRTWKGRNYSAKRAEMKIRPIVRFFKRTEDRIINMIPRSQGIVIG